jgi:hypothetical protein
MPKEVDGEIIDEHNFQKVFDLKGIYHSGFDCFVFKRSSFDGMNFGNVFIGVPPVGQVVLGQVEQTANNFYHINNSEDSIDYPATFHLGSDMAWAGDRENNRMAFKSLWEKVNDIQWTI